MEITVNGNIRQISDSASLPELLAALKYNQERIAIWVNGSQLLHREYAQYRLTEGDQLKIVRIFGGG